VVMNLVVNARDAMTSGGTLTLATELVETDTHPSADLPAGRWVVLSVTDTGTGIREDIQPHLFEPFFTTKELGQGTGLGLSTVYGIVTTAGGHLRFVTAPGRGTTFRVYWPVSEERSRTADKRPLDAHQPVAEKAKSKPSTSDLASATRATILLAEDLPAVRSLTAQILTSAGFVVTEAADGEEAFRKAAGLSAPPDVLVTDVQMPGMNGRELAARIRAKWPGVRVLFISGFEPDVQAAPPDESREAFLPKPFSPEELIQAVGKLMEG
jgi:two-component system cell cycle sensor histidine kinase/response regulator CckA